jgi:hypothetical protein
VRGRLNAFLSAACAILAALTLLLAWQNRSLKAELAAVLSAPPPGALKAGDVVAPFDVVDTKGQTSRVAFDGAGDTLLLVFSSTCGACRETLPLWNRLLAQGVPQTVHVVGIQTDFQQGAGEPLPVPDLRFPVFGFAAMAGEPLSKFPSIPGAAVLDKRGAVKSVWFGVPTEAQLSELRRALAS